MLEELPPEKPLGLNQTAAEQDLRVVSDVQTLYSYQLLEPLHNAECVNAYANTFLTARSNLILVYDLNSTNLTEPWHYNTWEVTILRTMEGEAPDPSNWICSTSTRHDRIIASSGSPVPCSEGLASINTSDWHSAVIPDAKVSYCLSQRTTPHCAVRFSPHIAWTVIAFNFIKVVVLGYIAWGGLADPLLTFGDAVASFMTSEDLTTRGLCLMGKKDVEYWTGVTPRKTVPLSFTEREARWRSAVSNARWAWCLVL